MNPLTALVADGTLKESAELSAFTTYKFGGSARWLAEVGDDETLHRLVGGLEAHGDVEVAVVGRGSNLVVSDRGFDGVVIRLVGDYLAIDADATPVTAGGAAPLPLLARDTVKAGRGGLEFFVGIPGSVGGAVRMNAGGHGTETADILVEAEVVDLRSGSRSRRSSEDLELRYRHSNLDTHELVTRAWFDTTAQDPEIGERRLREITQWRKEHQPGGTFNAGSVFKNPPGDYAGRIIDDLGLKGFRVGGASVSERHANFFVADPATSAQDIHDLVMEVRSRVSAATGIDLEPEIVFLGEFGHEHG
ncbi:MAG: UDP-N-acetylmuramate dehydrogenase [Acidimicrobiia bacterium]|nr:UDP-N-acetylmuramate dehydrogenase [Acidimicrobiia bacterium]